MKRRGLNLQMFDPSGAEEWHGWLLKNHLAKNEVWLVFHKKAKAHSVSYDEALDEALAFGWIDSILRRVDDDRYVRKFTPRRPWSIWSRLNIERVERLRKEGKMTSWGEAAYGKRTSEISMLEKVNAEGAKVPGDFEEALAANKEAWVNFQRMAPSHRKRYLIWIGGAKRPDTRKKRIDEAVLLVAKNVKNLLK